MIENLPNYITIVFGLTTMATFYLFHTAIKQSSLGNKANFIALGMIAWLIFQMVLSLNLYYLNTAGAIPPRFPLFSFLPTFALIIVLFNTKAGKTFIDSLPLDKLTLLNIIRIPVEVVLFWLFIHHAIPELLTFEGRNFDILAGISAPLVYYFGFIRNKFSKKLILGWNIVCLLLLINIVFMAALSFPTVLQQFAFDQPNIGLLYFPFFWLPSFIVPIVFFTHFVSIRRLIKS